MARTPHCDGCECDLNDEVDFMKTVSVSPNVVKYAEDTKGYAQTVDGRVAELISKGVQHEREGT